MHISGIHLTKSTPIFDGRNPQDVSRNPKQAYFSGFLETKWPIFRNPEDQLYVGRIPNDRFWRLLHGVVLVIGILLTTLVQISYVTNISNRNPWDGLSPSLRNLYDTIWGGGLGPVMYALRAFDCLMVWIFSGLVPSLTHFVTSLRTTSVSCSLSKISVSNC